VAVNYLTPSQKDRAPGRGALAREQEKEKIPSPLPPKGLLSYRQLQPNRASSARSSSRSATSYFSDLSAPKKARPVVADNRNRPRRAAGYSPDFNPLERLWLRLKADWLWDFIAHTSEELSQRLCAALKSFIDQPSKTASIFSIRK